MRKTAFIVLTVLVLSGCVNNRTTVKPSLSPFVDRYLKNVRQITFDGDNGEAYFSWDDLRLVYQSNRGGYACDKIWVFPGIVRRNRSPLRAPTTCGRCTLMTSS
jgi:hypothetical protein